MFLSESTIPTYTEMLLVLINAFNRPWPICCACQRHPQTQSTVVHVQLNTATDFLSKIHPLKHTAVQRKSSVHHAMCEMLTAILIHLVRENRPR